MRFENVGRLLAGLEDVLQEMKYTWIDSHGVIHMQQSTFRVNCMDCLDRTNVCQVGLSPNSRMIANRQVFLTRFYFTNFRQPSENMSWKCS